MSWLTHSDQVGILLCASSAFCLVGNLGKDRAPQLCASSGELSWMHLPPPLYLLTILGPCGTLAHPESGSPT